uniref:Sushi domain-containing protein n=1 Tax=Myripristis murdjan TaxID=586833 RepID=A0A667ZTS9_9TELE
MDPYSLTTSSLLAVGMAHFLPVKVVTLDLASLGVSGLQTPSSRHIYYLLCLLVPVGCGMPPPLEFGDISTVVKNNYDHGETVEYFCQTYYTLDGQTHKTCSNGQWTGEMRCLRPCTVTLDDMRRNNIGLKYKPDSKMYSPHKDFLEFNCTTGSPDGRLAMRQQCIDGVMLLPSCQ